MYERYGKRLLDIILSLAATGNTALFSREEIAQKLRGTEHPAEEG